MANSTIKMLYGSSRDSKVHAVLGSLSNWNLGASPEDGKLNNQDAVSTRTIEWEKPVGCASQSFKRKMPCHMPSQVPSAVPLTLSLSPMAS